MAEYIEREAVRDAFRMEFDEDYADDIVNRLPIADVQEVRHGKWENVGDNLIMEQTTIVGKYVKCSECGNEILVARTDNGSYRFSNYCANCGARMSEKVGECNGNYQRKDFVK